MKPYEKFRSHHKKNYAEAWKSFSVCVNDDHDLEIWKSTIKSASRLHQGVETLDAKK